MGKLTIGANARGRGRSTRRPGGVVWGEFSGGSVTDAARESGLSRQAIYRALARIRAWVEGEA